MTAPESAPRHLCWFDTEFTSLDLDGARLLQVSLVVTDVELRPLVPQAPPGVPAACLVRNGLNIYLRRPADWIPGEFHRSEMLEVLERCAASSVEPAQADEWLAHYLDAAVGSPAASIRERPLLAGNSVHNDWFLARRDLPLFTARLHYRLLDVSALKSEWLAALGGDAPELLDKEDPSALLAAFPGADLAGGRAHDAYYDAQASLAELAWYRARLRSERGLAQDGG